MWALKYIGRLNNSRQNIRTVAQLVSCSYGANHIQRFLAVDFIKWDMIMLSICISFTRISKTVYLGTIQVLRQHVFDLFRPTHPPYQQTSAFSYTHLKHDVSISSYPPTYKNKAKIRRGWFLLKKTKKVNFNSFFFKKDYPRHYKNQRVL